MPTKTRQNWTRKLADATAEKLSITKVKTISGSKLHYSDIEGLSMKMVYCSKCTIGEEVGPSHAITGRQRIARVVAGVGWFALVWVLPRDSAPAITWPLAIVAAWFGISHIVAGLTGYPDCPELGAIASVVRGRYVQTRCGPWAWLDHWLEPRS